MRIGAYQFASTDEIPQNLSVIAKAIGLASERGVRLLVFHECALCGYPPVESSIGKISRDEIEAALHQISALADQFDLFVAVGTIRFEREKRFNSIVIFDNNGNTMGYYDKRALWGWDLDHYSRGEKMGLFEIDHLKIGFRICFDIRFPECFRELYRQKADLCFVSFSDTSETPNSGRYDTIKAHILTRAIENVMPVVSVNSISRFQTAPTAVFDCDGDVEAEAELNREELLTYDFDPPELTFGRRGRIENSDYFMNQGDSAGDPALKRGTRAQGIKSGPEAGERT